MWRRPPRSAGFSGCQVRWNCGLYNIFCATLPWMRWPLDCLFHDPQFWLVEMARFGEIGSDHFPMWFVLAPAKTKAANGSADELENGEAHEIKRTIVEECRRDRDPLGGDWEQE